jgi:hypothetical protein
VGSVTTPANPRLCYLNLEKNFACTSRCKVHSESPFKTATKILKGKMSPHTSAAIDVGKEKKRSRELKNPSKQRRKDDGANGFDEIESLFAEKKQQKREQKTERTVAPQQSSSPFKERAKRSRTEVSVSKKCPARWTDDGLGGKYDPEGYTGRVDQGIKIFKAHVLNKPNSGSSKDCPFDCDCCVI